MNNDRIFKAAKVHAETAVQSTAQAEISFIEGVRFLLDSLDITGTDGCRYCTDGRVGLFRYKHCLCTECLNEYGRDALTEKAP